MGYLTNYADLVRASFSGARLAPEWARPWMRARLIRHLARDSVQIQGVRAEAPGEDPWGFLGALDGDLRREGERLRESSEGFAARARANGERAARARCDSDAVLRQVISVRDWLHGAFAARHAPGAAAGDPEGARRLARRLERLTFAQALDASERWHADLRRRAGRDALGVGDPDAVQEVLALEGGWRWVRLLTPEALDHEGAAMGHCVGGGAYDDAEILSLRDARNRPHVTVEVDHEQSGAFVQIQGRGNHAVAERHVPAVAALVGCLRPPALRHPGRLGCLWRGGRLVPVRDLPEGSRVEGDLDLSGCTWIRDLPRGLRVGGALLLSGCRALRRLPEGLDVEGALHRGHDDLAAVFADLIYHAVLDLRGCSTLEGLPEEVAVRGTIATPDGARHKRIEDARAWFADPASRPPSVPPTPLPESGMRTDALVLNFLVARADPHAPPAP